MANIVLAYGEWKGTTGEYLAAAFRELGHQVDILPLQRFRRAKVNMALRYLRTSAPLISWVNARRWLRANRLSPDLFLWVESPRFVEIRIDRQFPCPTAAYVVDTHTRRWELTDLARPYDTIFVAQKSDAEGMSSEGLPAHWLPLAAAPNTHKPVDVPVEFDVGFVGNIESASYRERFELLRGLSQEFQVHVAQAYGEDMSREYCRCRIGFNKSLRGDVNMRVFEIMATGVPLVTDRIGNGLKDLFEEGKEFVGFERKEDLTAKVRELLEDANLRGRLGSRARERILAGHTYVHRAKKILEIAMRPATSLRA